MGGEVMISISNNILAFESSAVTFRYADLPIITSVSRQNISMSGNSTVVVNGSGFSGDDLMSCKFQYFDMLSKTNVSALVQAIATTKFPLNAKLHRSTLELRWN